MHVHLWGAGQYMCTCEGKYSARRSVHLCTYKLGRCCIGSYCALLLFLKNNVYHLFLSNVIVRGSSNCNVSGLGGVCLKVLQHVKLNEDETTSSSRIFIKILFQELSEYMGLSKLNGRLKDE